MSLVVPCPGCPTKLSAPESAAGKQIRCPKCKAVVPVPAFVPAEEVPVVDAKVTAPAPPKTKSKPALDTTTTLATCGGCASTVCVIGTITDGLIHCPNCGFATPVPKTPGSADDEDEDERPRKKKRRSVLDDDDDEEDARPRKRKRKPVESGGGGRVVFFVMFGLLLLGLCGGGLYFLFSKGGKGGLFAKRTPAPAGWKEFGYPQDGFKAHFPQAPTQATIPVGGIGPGGRPIGGIGPGGKPVGGGIGRGGDFAAEELKDAESFSQYTAMDWNTSVRAEIVVIRYRSSVPAVVRNEMRNTRNSTLGGLETRSLKWLGHDAVEYTHPGFLMRVVATDRHVFIAEIQGPNGRRTTPETEAGFFDNFELTK